MNTYLIYAYISCIHPYTHMGIWIYVCVHTYVHMYVDKTAGYHTNKVLPKISHSFRLNSWYQELPEERKTIAGPEI